MYAPYIYIFLFNLEKLTCRGNKHTIHTDGIRFSCIFTIFFSLFVFLPCKFSSIHIYCRIIYIYLKCSSHGPAAIFTPAAPPLFTYLDYELFSRRIQKFANKNLFIYVFTRRHQRRPSVSDGPAIFQHWYSLKEQFSLFISFLPFNNNAYARDTCASLSTPLVFVQTVRLKLQRLRRFQQLMC